MLPVQGIEGWRTRDDESVAARELRVVATMVDWGKIRLGFRGREGQFALKKGGGGERPTGRRGFRPRWPTGGRWWGAAAPAAQPGSEEVRWKGKGSLTRGPGEKRK